MRELRLSHSAPRMHIAELSRIRLWQELVCIFQKKKRIGATRWRTFMSQIRYSLERISKGSDIDGVLHN